VVKKITVAHSISDPVAGVLSPVRATLASKRP
jgi:hypothetical protein